MKTKPYHHYLIPLAILATLLFLGSCSKKETQQTNQPPLAREYPNEWMYNQRAYPHNYINKKAINEAVAQSRSILGARAPQENDWELVGPLNTGGRITDIALSPNNDDVFYAATAVGGVFKTTNGGAAWEPIFDDIAKASIGDIALAPSNPQILYVGTGEANGSGTSGAFFGDGIYRSEDAGASFTNIGLDGTDHIGRIVIDPTDPDRVFVAATGKLYGKNEDRGIYRTTNGGNSWDRVLFVTDSTAAIDVVLNPTNTDVLYAAMWERTRKPWQRDYGGLSSAIHQSTDGGNTWAQLGPANGLPAPNAQTGRIGLAISPSDPATVYARFTTNEITNQFDAIYKTTNGGATWAEVNTSSISGIDSTFGWYFGNLRVNPTNPDDVFVLGQSLARTTNSGGSWNFVNGMHVDHHAMEFSQNDPNFILAGNDGGIYASTNNGNTWNKFTNLPITQFYNIEVDNLDPFNVYGGTQDNNTIRSTTAGTNDWFSVWGGDGFHVRINPVNNNYVYVESQFGGMGRSTDGGNTFNSATNGINPSDRNNWNTPIELSNFDPSQVFYGTNRLYRSTHAASWNAISPDLTDGQHPSGSLSFGTLTAIATSYNNLDVFYTGSDDGNVQVTFNGGTTWENISAGLPDFYVTSLAISPTDDNTIYVTFSGFRYLDYQPHVFKSTDGGQNWEDISGNLPSIPVNDIVLSPANGVILVSTDLYVWYSRNGGASWDILGNELPGTIIQDLKIHGPTNMLYAGTFGRSMHKYDLDNLVLGVNDFSFTEKDITLYPNPARERFNIKQPFNGAGTISIMAVSGREIKQVFKGNLSKAQPLNISTQGIPAGMYFVKIESGGASINKKLIVQ